ncbi:MAG: sterol desaturase family protein [Alphaproteobacteria bacterium]|nr:sterol desaturase family protein [Alphaproteobacteria bacterium]
MEFATLYLKAIYLNIADVTQRLNWMYLLTALAAALLSYRLYSGEKLSIKSFLSYAFPKGSLTSKSARMDYIIVFFMPFWIAVLVFPFAISVLTVAEALLGGLNYLLGENESHDAGIVGMAIYSFFLFIAYDFGQFFSHYLNHRIWFLWEMHKIHHSAETMTPVTAYRFHPMDLLWTTVVIAITTGICQGFFHWLWNMEPQLYNILGLQFGILIFYLAAYNLRHSHVWLPYPKPLMHVFMSPAQHQIHHSVARKHWDRNFGYMFSFWDWMFGTIYIPQEREHLTYGLGKESGEYQSLPHIYVLPFTKIGNRMKKIFVKSDSKERASKASIDQSFDDISSKRNET